jgi:hypothetical protein
VASDGSDCRLWLEESASDVQAVASCDGFEPLRLTAEGATLPPLGPARRPPILYDLVPLHTFDAQPLMDAIRPAETRALHPLLAALGLLAFLPLFLLGLTARREARRDAGRAPLEGELPGEWSRRLRSAAWRHVTVAAAGAIVAVLFGLEVV